MESPCSGCAPVQSPRSDAGAGAIDLKEAPIVYAQAAKARHVKIAGIGRFMDMILGEVFGKPLGAIASGQRVDNMRHHPPDTLCTMSEGVNPPRFEPTERPLVPPGSAGDNTASRVTDAQAETLEDQRVAEMMEEETIDVEALADAVAQQEAPDAADTLEDLDEEEAAEVLEEMDAEAAAEALAEMKPILAAGVIEDLFEEGKVEYAGHLLELMAPDDAVDLLQALHEDRRRALLHAMKHEPARELGALITYDRESAGGMMTTDFLALREDMTVNQAVDTIRRVEIAETVSHALVTDDDNRLVGILTLRKLLLSRPHERIGDLMNRDVEAIAPDLDREAVAHTFDRYDYSILPVVDDRGALLGIITVDDVIDIIREEQTEDVQRSVGASAGEAVYSPVREKIRGRLPWLGASLGMMCGSASVVLLGEEMIERMPVLAFLLPAIAAVVGNGGQQAMMVTLRGIVLQEIRPERVGPLLMREVTVGLFNGLLLGLAVFGIVLVLSGFIDSATWRIGLIAGTAMAVSMTAATLSGTGIPLLMKKAGIDPALASSIILIMITDAVSFSTLLALTFFLVHRMAPLAS